MVNPFEGGNLPPSHIHSSIIRITDEQTSQDKKARERFLQPPIGVSSSPKETFRKPSVDTTKPTPVTEVTTTLGANTSDHAIELKELGISSSWELARYEKVLDLVGKDIALQEVLANVAAYEREFLLDHPISHAHEYYMFNGELYSQNSDHPIFNIKSQFDKTERNGATYRGFERFEKLITESKQPDEVFLWYSPAGLAADKDQEDTRFKDIFFDAGRLYFCFNQEGKSIHIDLKIDEKRFSIVEFLDYFKSCTQEKRPEGQTADEAIRYYLENPIAPKLTAQQLFAYVEDFMKKKNLTDKVMYVSQRDSKTPTSHTFQEFFNTTQEELIGFYTKKEKPDVRPLTSDDVKMPSLKTKEAVLNLYWQKITPYLLANGGKLKLYGCSTTSEITSIGLREAMQGVSIADIIGSHYGMLNRAGPLNTETVLEVLGIGNEGSLYHESYNCPGCKTKLSGEHKTNKSNWRTACEKCGHQFNCAPTVQAA